MPFNTPTLVSSWNPYPTASSAVNVTQQYVVNNLTGDGADSMVVAGRMSQPATASTWQNTNIQLFDWSNGQFVNDTAKWFPNGINSVLGTDPTVQFADFFHRGHTDMLVSPSTDMNYYGTAASGNSQALLFNNTGNNFTLSTIDLGAQVWGHGATVADLTGSGFKDVIISDYGPNTTFLMNNHVSGFSVYQARGQNDLSFGTSSIAAADFLGTGKTQLVATDSQVCANDSASRGCTMSSTTKMYNWNINSSNQLSITWAKDLPTPIFGNGSHNYLAIAYDFLGNGIPDVIVFSQPGLNTFTQSAIQFLQNDGHGNFTDVTSSMLKGYNGNTAGTYHPQFVDLGNGLQSIIVSESDYSGLNNSTQILVKQSAGGPYVAAYQNILTDFASEANLIASSWINKGNQVALVKDANGNLFLVSTVQFHDGGNGSNPLVMKTYISQIGGAMNTVSAQAAFNTIKAQWPWMSPAQVNAVLAQTSSSYLTLAGSALLLNPVAMMNPVGNMSVATRSGMTALTGGITGVNMSAFDRMQAFDSLGRNFSLNFNSGTSGLNSFNTNTEAIGQFGLSSRTEYLLNSTANTYQTAWGDMRLGFDNQTRHSHIAGMPDDAVGSWQLGHSMPDQWTVGIPKLYSYGNFTTGLQYTNLNSSPWVSFSGSFGSVRGSTTLEQVMTYARDGFSLQGAVMRTTTNFAPGLVTDVSPITAAWAETGYRYSNGHDRDWGVYAGVQPVILSGNITATLPTGVDTAGNPVYTTTKMGIVNDHVGYVRALYTGVINRNSDYKLSCMASTTGQYRAMVEYRYAF